MEGDGGASMAEERCPDCGMTFDSQEALDAHRLEANHPALPQDDKLECERCGFVMESPEELARHMRMIHGAPAR
jgi:uncharacterized C2H2 Zn-finger protein